LTGGRDQKHRNSNKFFEKIEEKGQDRYFGKIQGKRVYFDRD
jgi:hypothetical protein